MGQAFRSASAFRRAALFLVCLAVLGAAPGPPGQAGDQRILVLASYGAGRPGIEALLQGYLWTLVGSGLSLDQIFIENLDLERGSDPAFRRSLAGTLRMKYRLKPVDLVYVLEQPALDFFLQELDEVTGGVPVILTRAILPPGAGTARHRFVRQLVAYDVEGTLHRAMELFPATRRVLFVAGGTDSDRGVLAQAYGLMAAWQGQVACEDTSLLTLDQTKARIHAPPPGTLIVVLPFNRDAAGRTAVQMEVALQVAATAGAPVFTLWDTPVGRGAVGGNVTNFEDVGRQAGAASIDLLRGTGPGAAALTELPARSAPKFDWVQIQRWHGNLKALPAASTFINKPASLWHEYRGPAILALVFLLGQTILIALLLLERRLRNQTQRRLRESEDRFRILVEQAPEAILVYDPALGELLDANAKAEALFGVSREQLRARGIQPFYAPEQPDGRPASGTFTEHNRAALAGEVVCFERAIRSADGQKRICEVRLVQLPAMGRPLLRGSFLDITARKEAEESRNLLQAQLYQVQKIESLGSLAGGVAHDMNNVLGAILALATAHRAKAGQDPQLHRDLDTITLACQRGGAMVKGLLSFARQGLAEERAVALNDLVGETVALLERTTLQKTRLQLDLAKDLRPVQGDPTALSHSLMNLCVNAVDAMPEGGTLTLRTCNEPSGLVLLEVADTGSGMPREVLDKALEPFFTTKGQGQGTGLGLSMVYGTVKAHGGTLTIESEAGQGTRVQVRLPAHLGGEAGPAAAAEVPAAAPHRVLRVLLVDDDELIQRSIPMVLEILGHAGTAVSSGEAALALLETGFEPDVVILDMNMPGMDGLATLANLRRLRPALPVLLATGRVDQAVLDLVGTHPGVALLPKPYGLEELEAMLRRLG